MLPIIMGREFIARSTKMPRSIGQLSASAQSHHGLSSAVFITDIAESDFRHTQVATKLLKSVSVYALRSRKRSATLGPYRSAIMPIAQERPMVTAARKA